MVDLSLHLMDIMQNSVVVGSTFVEAGIIAEKKKNLLTMYVKDDGWGMSPETVKRVSDPFYTTRSTRKAGLGLPLLMDAAHMAGGEVYIESEVGRGTTVTSTFQIDHIDRKPLGDVADTITASIMGYPDMEFHLLLKNDDAEYVFRTEDVREQIGEVPINDIEIISFIRDMLNEQITLMFGGILNEIIS